MLLYKFARHKREASEETVAKGTCEYGYWRANTLWCKYVLELILFVGNFMHITGLVNGLHPNF